MVTFEAFIGVGVRRRRGPSEPTALPPSRPRLPRLDEAGLVGEHDRLDAVAEIDLLQDVPDVRLHGRLAEKELLCSSASPAATVRTPATSCARGASLSRKPLAPPFIAS